MGTPPVSPRPDNAPTPTRTAGPDSEATRTYRPDPDGTATHLGVGPTGTMPAPGPPDLLTGEAAASNSNDSPPAPTLPLGSAPAEAGVPGYRIEGVLGRGGMGVVFKARQLNLNRAVALKMVLAGGHAGSDELARFVREGEAVARLDHPNVVRVYHAGRHGDRPFLAMEFVGGGSLADRLRDGPLPPGEAARVAAGVARGIAFSHARGVLHRDLKPHNVLLAGDGTPKVTDFGLAKPLDTGEELTASGAVMGTPQYMAPEQARGEVHRFGPPTDVYGLGAVLYAALTGRPPFQAPHVMEILVQVAEDPPVAPRRLSPGVPRDLETVCLKCLEKEPAKRYASAADLADDLDRFLAGEPVRARPVSRAERAVRWARRHPAPATAAGLAGLAALLAAGGGVALAAYQAQRAANVQRELDDVRRAELARGSFRENLARARRLRADGNLAEARPAYAGLAAVLDATPDAAGEDGAAARAELAEVEAALQARATAARARADLEAFRRHRDDAIYHATLFTGTDPAENRAKARAAAEAGLALFGLDRDSVAADRLAGWAALGYGPGEQDEVAAGCQELLLVLAEGLARPHPRPADPAPGVRAAAAVLARADALVAAGRPSVRAVPERLARYHRELGDEAGAAAAAARAAGVAEDRPTDWFARAVEPFQRADAPDFGAAAGAAERLLRLRPDHFWGQYLLAVCRLNQRRLAEARDGMGACLALRPDFDLARAYRGYVRAELGDHPGAEADYEDALRRSADPLVRFLALNNRAILRARQGRWDEAAVDLRAALGLRWDVPQAYRTLASIRLGQGDPAGAVAALSDAVARLPGQAVLHLDRGRAHLRGDDRAVARRDFERAAELQPVGPVAVEAHLDLARLLLADGDPAAALAAADRALRAAPPTSDAHRLRADLLVRLDRFAEADAAAGEALRLAGPDAGGWDFRLRGLLKARSKQYPEAVEAYTAALARPLGPADRRAVLAARAAVYLVLDAARLAAADYDAVLVEAPRDGDALAGRAVARARLGRVRGGLADAAAAEAGPAPSARQLYLAAQARGLAYQQVSGNRARAREEGYDVPAEFKRLVAALRRAVDAHPAAERAGFWAGTVRQDPAFQPLLPLDAVAQLGVAYRPKTDAPTRPEGER